MILFYYFFLLLFRGGNCESVVVSDGGSFSSQTVPSKYPVIFHLLSGSLRVSRWSPSSSAWADDLVDSPALSAFSGWTSAGHSSSSDRVVCAYSEAKATTLKIAVSAGPATLDQAAVFDIHAVATSAQVISGSLVLVPSATDGPVAVRPTTQAKVLKRANAPEEDMLYLFAADSSDLLLFTGRMPPAGVTTNDQPVLTAAPAPVASGGRIVSAGLVPAYGDSPVSVAAAFRGEGTVSGALKFFVPDGVADTPPTDENWKAAVVEIADFGPAGGGIRSISYVVCGDGGGGSGGVLLSSTAPTLYHTVAVGAGNKLSLFQQEVGNLRNPWIQTVVYGSSAEHISVLPLSNGWPSVAFVGAGSKLSFATSSSPAVTNTTVWEIADVEPLVPAGLGISTALVRGDLRATSAGRPAIAFQDKEAPTSLRWTVNSLATGTGTWGLAMPKVTVREVDTLPVSSIVISEQQQTTSHYEQLTNAGHETAAGLQTSAGQPPLLPSSLTPNPLPANREQTRPPSFLANPVVSEPGGLPSSLVPVIVSLSILCLLVLVGMALLLVRRRRLQRPHRPSGLTSSLPTTMDPLAGSSGPTGSRSRSQSRSRRSRSQSRSNVDKNSGSSPRGGGRRSKRRSRNGSVSGKAGAARAGASGSNYATAYGNLNEMVYGSAELGRRSSENYGGVAAVSSGDGGTSGGSTQQSNYGLVSAGLSPGGGGSGDSDNYGGVGTVGIGAGSAGVYNRIGPASPDNSAYDKVNASVQTGVFQYKTFGTMDGSSSAGGTTPLYVSMPEAPPQDVVYEQLPPKEKKTGEYEILKPGK